MKSLLFTLLLAFVFVLPLSVQAQNPCNPCGKAGTVFHVNDPMGRNSVTFKSQAPLEDIIGTTNQITGYINFDPQNPDKGGHGKLTVAVASLNTGIPLRNEHLLGADWLDASKYPDITIEIEKVKDIKKVKSTKGSATYDVTIVADLSIHGKTRRVDVAGRITYLKESEQTRTKLAGDLLAMRATFAVNLNDFDITGPKGSGLIGSKVGETIEIEVSVLGSTSEAMAANPCNPCNPCKGKAKKNPCNPCGK